MDENVTRERPDARSFEERVFARFDALDERMSRLEDRMSTLEERVSMVEDRLSGVEASITKLDDRMTRLEDHVSKIDERLSGLDEKVDRRLQETRPIWEAVQAQLKRIDSKLDLVIADLYETRTDFKMLDQRVANLEGTRHS